MNAVTRNDFVGELCVALTHEWDPERILVNLTCYLDESGTHDGSPHTILAGIMGTAAQWSRFQTDLDILKRQTGLKVFHGKDFKKRQGEFSGWSEDKLRLVIDRLGVISGSMMDAATISLPTSDYNEIYRAEPIKKPRHDTKYGLCFRSMAMHFAREAMRRLGSHKKASETKIRFIMESGHKHEGDAKRVFHEIQQELQAVDCYLMEKIDFGGKTDADPLMVADFLAHGGLLLERHGLYDHPPPSGLATTPEAKEMSISVLKFSPDGLAEIKRNLLATGQRIGRKRTIYDGKSGVFRQDGEE